MVLGERKVTITGIIVELMSHLHDNILLQSPSLQLLLDNHALPVPLFYEKSLYALQYQPPY